MHLIGNTTKPSRKYQININTRVHFFQIKQLLYWFCLLCVLKLNWSFTYPGPKKSTWRLSLEHNISRNFCSENFIQVKLKYNIPRVNLVEDDGKVTGTWWATEIAPRSPDIMPVEFLFWGLVKEKVYYRTTNNWRVENSCWKYYSRHWFKCKPVCLNVPEKYRHRRKTV